MMTSDYLDRFAGIGRLYGMDALEAFSQSQIAVVGLGGVGSWAAEALARSGIGEIRLIDLDDVCVSNTNRQSHALLSTLGQSKVMVTADRLKEINPELVVHEIESFATQDNLAEILPESLDYVVDAIDSAGVKAAMIAYCRRRKIPIITTGGAGGLIDTQLVRIADLTKTKHDPLAAKVRSILKRHFDFSKSGRKFGVECVYSEEQARYPRADGGVCATKSFDTSVRLDCSTGMGASTAVTASFGLMSVSRVLLKISERKLRSL